MFWKSHFKRIANTNFLRFQKARIFSYIKQGEGEREKIFLNIEGKQKSYWHDVPLRNEDHYNMIIEIPAYSKTIIEMNKTEPWTPLMPKIRKVQKNTENPIKIRDYSKDPRCNYGFFPQTFSDKSKRYRNLYVGDGDPLDVIEIGGPFDYKAGEIIQVKIIGSFCLIDEGETDWKIIVANLKSSEQPNRDNISYIMHWFKTFKTFYGKKENVILDNDKLFSYEETLRTIEESNLDYTNSEYHRKFLENN